MKNILFYRSLVVQVVILCRTEPYKKSISLLKLVDLVIIIGMDSVLFFLLLPVHFVFFQFHRSKVLDLENFIQISCFCIF